MLDGQAQSCHSPHNEDVLGCRVNCEAPLPLTSTGYLALPPPPLWPCAKPPPSPPPPNTIEITVLSPLIHNHMICMGDAGPGLTSYVPISEQGIWFGTSGVVVKTSLISWCTFCCTSHSFARETH